MASDDFFAVAHEAGIDPDLAKDCVKIFSALDTDGIGVGLPFREMGYNGG